MSAVKSETPGKPNESGTPGVPGKPTGSVKPEAPKDENRCKGKGAEGRKKAPVPKGGVKAGAEGVDAQGNEMIAGSAGLAAIAAAGLGFATLRRSRSDS
ncbi:hypothetical protein ACFXDJ_15325 [Streptomyces sp. NPDC059443]|uniref:hypothetical protein n=1 Tax=unclassified Streptomyces TaxID=2593676 RepID=UPI0036A5BDC3